MNRTQRALVRAAHKDLNLARSFKNDALEEKKSHRGMYAALYGSRESRFEEEKEIYKGKVKNLRKLKKYNGHSGYMTENDYMEVMGA